MEGFFFLEYRTVMIQIVVSKILRLIGSSKSAIANY